MLQIVFHHYLIMIKKKRNHQLRACSVCNKHGHNKARCPIFLAEKIEQEFISPPSIKMVLHERNNKISSPHIVDLKSNDNPWSKIYTFAPDNTEKITKSKSSKQATAKKSPTISINFKPEKKSFTQKLSENYHLWQQKKNLKNIETDEKNLIASNEDILIPTINLIPTNNEQEKKINNTPLIKNNLSDIEPEIKKFNWHKILPTKDALTTFAFRTACLIIVCVIIPLQTKSYYQSVKTTTVNIATVGTEGFMALQESTAAILSADIDNAENSVNQALLKFEHAIYSLEENHRLLQKIVSFVPIVSNEVQSRQKLITAGQKIASGNKFLIQGLHQSQNNENTNLTERISILTSYLQAASPNYQIALEDLSTINSGVLPYEYQAIFNDFRLLFATFLDDLNNIIDLGKAMNEIFGGQGLRRYLLVFQNEHEIRATGGFIGSFAIIDIKDGKIINLEVPAGGSYDLQGQLDVLVEPPTPLLLANRRWEFQDGNWFPDFPTTAEKLLWFYRYARQITADGVIAINSSVLERLLSVLGPITDEQRSVILSDENAILELQKIVEEGPEKLINKPKQILTDLAPQLMVGIYSASADKTMPLVVNLAEALEKKEIQAYFTDQTVQETIKSFGWSGQILPTTAEQDYLMVVNTNIQGQKTDAKIIQDISHQAVVANDGTITNTVIITREHTGTPSQTLYGTANIDYIRIYVPAGSTLVSAGGFTWPDEKHFRAPLRGTIKDEFLTKNEIEVGIDEKTGTRITNEFGKTTFGNWIIVQPGEIQQIQFTYKLPFKLNLDDKKNSSDDNIFKKLISDNYLTSRYQLIVQKQSGINSDFDSQIIFPINWYPHWTQGNNLTLAANGVSINSFKLKSDQVWSLLMRGQK